MKRRILLPSAALLAGLSLVAFASAKRANPELAPPSAETKAQVPELAVTQYTLDNGLTVMLSEDHELPSFAAHLVYLVGSGHEEKGRTGFAHLFEHLMFQGSAHFDRS